MATGIGGIVYDESKVLDPRKKIKPGAQLKTGLPVKSNDGINTTAGPNYFAQQQLPVSGSQPVPPDPAPLATPTQTAAPLATPPITSTPAGQTILQPNKQTQINRQAPPQLPQGATLLPGEDGAIINVTDTTDPTYQKTYRLPGVQQSLAQPDPVGGGHTVNYMNRISPLVQGLAPLRAMRVAGEAAARDAKTIQDQTELSLKAPVYQAQAASNFAHAKLLNMQASPEYISAQGRIAGIKQQQDQQKEFDKNLRDLLTNGYGVAPTPQAMKAYVGYQTSLENWDKDVTKNLNSLTKAYKPEEIQQIKGALLNFHRNPKDENAQKSLLEAQKILTGGGKGTVPAWFVNASQMPTFETTGLQPWKQPLMIPGA